MSKIVTPDNITSDETMDYIVHLIKTAEKIKDFTARDKSNYVLDQIKAVVGTETFDRYESMFVSTITLVCKLGKNKELLKGINEGVKCCLPLFKKCL